MIYLVEKMIKVSHKIFISKKGRSIHIIREKRQRKIDNNKKKRVERREFVLVEQYRAVFKGGEGEIVEKRSRFIANVRPVETEEEAIEFIEEMKKKYYDARHNCSAFSIGVEQPIVRCSDDGEPSGTAGKPMLEVITGEKIHNIAVVVTRYFGGTLLGTGGLVRAYTQATQEGIKNSQIIEKNLARRLKLITNYNDIGKIQYLLGNEKIHIESSEYTDVVVMNLLVPVKQVEAIEKKLVEITNGKVQLEEGDTFYYAILDGQVLVFLGN